MYEAFYGLSRLPFNVTPDPTLMYMSAEHKEALATIMYGIEERKGFIVCTGEVGMGKTTVVRRYIEQADSEDLKLIYCFTPQMKFNELIEYLCRELHVRKKPNMDFSIEQLHARLLEYYTAGKIVALLVDEAQILSPKTIEILRLLSNLETNTEKLIQIVLIGQPELEEKLSRHNMRQVNQRVALRTRIERFSIAESVKYIEYRLLQTGAKSMKQVFSERTAKLIAKAADGIPRRVNVLADNVLIAGFGAGERPVSGALAKTIVNEHLARSGMQPQRKRGGLLGLRFN